MKKNNKRSFIYLNLFKRYDNSQCIFWCGGDSILLSKMLKVNVKVKKKCSVSTLT